MSRNKPAKPPRGEGTFAGQLKTTGYNGRAGGGVKYWRWDGSAWIRQRGSGAFNSHCAPCGQASDLNCRYNYIFM